MKFAHSGPARPGHHDSAPAPKPRLRPPGARAAGGVVFLVAAAAFLGSTPAFGQQQGTCSGPLVVRLAGAHAVTHQPIVDIADLERRLPQLEASIRKVVAQDPSLGSVVADALIAAIRGRSTGITERVMQRSETVRWMAYQPEPGRITALSPACLRLDRDYDAFEIAVAIAEPEPAAPRRASR